MLRAHDHMGRGAARVRGGFTLLELCLVVLIAGLIAAITIPQMLPLIAYGELEGAARHVAGYGRSVMASSALGHERLTVRFDLKNQEYWTVRWPDPLEESEKEKKKEDEDPQRAEVRRIAEGILRNPGDQELREKANSQLAAVTEDQDMAVGEVLQERFERYARMSINARARNVKHEGILSEIGPLFDKEFSLDDEEDQGEEVKEDLLARTSLPDGVVIESIHMGNTVSTSGIAEVEVSPSGLFETVTFYVRNEDKEYMTVIWDPITGRSHLFNGKEQPAE